MQRWNRKLGIALLGLSLVATPAFAAGTKPAPAASANAATTAAPAALTPSDRIFLADAMASSQKEIDASNFIAKQTASPKVRQFAQTMVRDHTQLLAQLQKIAGPTMPPPAPNNDPNPNLAYLKGAEQDKAYMDLMVNDHDVAVGKFLVTSDGPQHGAAVRDLAKKALPTVRKHDEMAKTLDRSLPAR
jgi:putative membrane protein